MPPSTTTLLPLGFVLIVVGIALLILSFGGRRVEGRGFGILFIGPIPILFGGGGRRWLLFTLIAALLFLLILALSTSPHVVGW